MEMKTKIALPKEDILSKHGYRVKSFLGEGSHGKIYSCERIADLTELAVKIIRKTPSNKFLEREISVMHSLNHDNIVNLHEVIESNDKVYLILDLANQGDLLDFVELNGALDSEMAKQIFRQIVAAVSSCHQHRVAHRDLNLHNILLTEDGHVKLADFGFSRQMTTSDLSQTFCGSVAYTAPEVLRGKEYSPFQADIWSLGIIIYAMCVGRLPFDDSNMIKMVRMQLKQSINFPADMDSDVKKLISLMLKPEVKDRISMEQIQESEWLLD